MFILIDMDRMVFCGKHANRAVLAALATIELAFSHASILPVEARYLQDFTHTELMLLYQNSTGDKYAKSLEQLQHAVFSVIRALDESDVNPQEALAQSWYVEDHCPGARCRYAKGSRVPTIEEGFFLPDPMHTTSSKAAAAQPPSQRDDPAPVATPIQAPAKTAPSRGASAVIFEVADQMWTAAGSPTALAEVLALRKAMMNELETAHGVKRSTSSSTLGQWQKLRIH